MANENTQTLLIAFFPFLLLLAEVRDIVVIGAGLFSMTWIGRQLYVSFKQRREAIRREERAEEKHALEMSILRKQLGEDDDGKPASKD